MTESLVGLKRSRRCDELETIIIKNKKPRSQSEGPSQQLYRSQSFIQKIYLEDNRKLAVHDFDLYREESLFPSLNMKLKCDKG